MRQRFGLFAAFTAVWLSACVQCQAQQAAAGWWEQSPLATPTGVDDIEITSWGHPPGVSNPAQARAQQEARGVVDFNDIVVTGWGPPAGDTHADLPAKLNVLDDSRCRTYGFTPGTPDYGHCRLKLDEIRALRAIRNSLDR